MARFALAKARSSVGRFLLGSSVPTARMNGLVIPFAAEGSRAWPRIAPDLRGRGRVDHRRCGSGARRASAIRSSAVFLETAMTRSAAPHAALDSRAEPRSSAQAHVLRITQEGQIMDCDDAGTSPGQRNHVHRAVQYVESLAACVHGEDCLFPDKPGRRPLTEPVVAVPHADQGVPVGQVSSQGVLKLTDVPAHPSLAVGGCAADEADVDTHAHVQRPRGRFPAERRVPASVFLRR